MMSGGGGPRMRPVALMSQALRPSPNPTSIVVGPLSCSSSSARSVSGDTSNSRYGGSAGSDGDFLTAHPFPSHPDLAVAGVRLEAGAARGLDQRVLHPVGQLRNHRRIDLSLKVFQQEALDGRDVAFDVRDARQFLIAVHAVLAGEHHPLDHAWRDGEIASQGILDAVDHDEGDASNSLSHSILLSSLGGQAAIASSVSSPRSNCSRNCASTANSRSWLMRSGG